MFVNKTCRAVLAVSVRADERCREVLSSRLDTVHLIAPSIFPSNKRGVR